MSRGAVALVQGASRGLGLQFCRSLLQGSPDIRVVATCRQPDQASDLQALVSNPVYGSRLTVHKLDVTKEDQIQATALEVEGHYGGLDLVVNCSAILHPSGRGETSLRDVNIQDLQETCRVNAFGPLLMTKHFGRLLQQGHGAIGGRTTDGPALHTGILANISAKVGSITENALGGWYSYRMSKAALNMATKTASIELGRGKHKVVCVTLHPGTVDTDLSKPYHRNVKNLFSPEESVTKLLTVIRSLTIADSGKFFLYDGKVQPF